MNGFFQIRELFIPTSRKEVMNQSESFQHRRILAALYGVVRKQPPIGNSKANDKTLYYTMTYKVLGHYFHIRRIVLFYEF